MHTKFTCEYLNAHIFYSCKWDEIRILFFLYIFMEIPCKNIFFTNHYLETNILVTHNNCGIKNTTIFKTGFSMLIKNALKWLYLLSLVFEICCSKGRNFMMNAMLDEWFALFVCPMQNDFDSLYLEHGELPSARTSPFFSRITFSIFELHKH